MTDSSGTVSCQFREITNPAEARMLTRTAIEQLEYAKKASQKPDIQLPDGEDDMSARSVIS